MNVLAWNARGLGNNRAFQEFRRLLVDTSPGLVFVSETKVTKLKANWWRHVLGFDGFFLVDASGLSGGLMLLWREPFDVTIHSYSPGHIDCGVKTKGYTWRFTGFYGNPETQERVVSWTLLRRLAGIAEFAHLPWVVGGDFNEILVAEDKWGGRNRSLWQMEAFREVLADCNLDELVGGGSGFTWTNKRKQSGVISEKLDRFVMTGKWYEAFALSKVEVLDEYGSDHRAIILKIIPKFRVRSKTGERRFHFEQKWFFDKSFATDFLIQWRRIGGVPINEKLGASRGFLTSWAGSRFDALGKQIKNLRKERIELLNKGEQGNVADDIARIDSQIVQLSEKEEIHWRQRSRVNWLAHGDRNTTYFHNRASMRLKRNTIHSLVDEVGEVRTKDEEIAQVIQDYYTTLFTSETPRAEDMAAITDVVESRVPDHLEDHFDEPFSAKEIKKALFQMHPTKSPGPDGFQPVFFQKLWGEIGHEVTRDCMNILNEGKSVSEWNSTYISLIPKVQHPKEVKEFRPISLCNTTYKIISKVIVNRLRGWLPHVVDESQSAFVPGRLISDNILVGFECMNWIRGRKNTRDTYVAAKLDMSKAYDRVEWPFLELMIKVMGFGRNIIRLIMSCVTSVRYSFVVNGKVYGEVYPTRGLRQGDPLSPFLFVIVSQGLSAILKAYTDRSLFEGVRIARNAPMITHLFFADDSLLFFKVKGDSPKRIMEALNLYSRASGQLINYEKSALTINPGASMEAIDIIKAEFGVQLVQSHSIYLGLPTFMMRKHRLQFSYLVDKVSKKLGGWMNKSFSMGGREVMIKSVIQSIPTYTMACFRVPMSVCSDIERRCARFWWGDKENERRMHWASWLELCKPKSKGGMGFRNLSDFNKALLAKQVWRLIRYPDSLVARLFKAKYYATHDIMQAKLSSNASFMWRSILWGREVLEEGMRWKVGDGKKIRVFQDSWLPNKSDGKSVSSARGLENITVSELIDDTHSWKRDKLFNVLVPQEAEEVLQIEIPRESREDMRFWIHDPKGEYSVKTGYLVATNYFSSPIFRSEDGYVKWWKFLWSFDLPPRVRIFAWRCFRNFIPTPLNLHRHHVPVFGRCSWCRKGWGTTSHVLIFCEKILERWKSFEFWQLLKRLNGLDINDIGGILQEKVSRENFRKWIMGLWMNWADLCDATHGGSFCRNRNLQVACENYIDSYCLAREQAAGQATLLPKEGSVTWLRPRRGRYRLDVDYAVDEIRGNAGMGAVARDCEGKVVFALAKPLTKSPTSTHGELRAIMHGICWCVEEALSPIEVYSDSLLAVHIINDEREVPGVLNEDLIEFFDDVKNLNIYSINHVRREANLAAHRLACLAKSLVSSQVWHDNCPPWLLDIVSNDLV